MGSRDKDAAFDKLLRRNFVGGAAARGIGAQTAASVNVPDRTNECPSADLLAAYYERALDAAEGARYELHFSQCDRCRQQLAALARSDESVGAGAAHRPAAGWSWFGHQWWLIPVAGTLLFAVAVYFGWTQLEMHKVAAPSEEAELKTGETGPAGHPLEGERRPGDVKEGAAAAGEGTGSGAAG
jgi:hypothetical protein